MKTVWPEHGGKTSVISSVLEEKGVQSKGVKDFSANINPFGMPKIMEEAMQRAIMNQSTYYPDLTYREHTDKVAMYEHVKPNQIRLTNGGAEAIHLSAALFKGKKVALFHPSFSEYELACRAHNVEYTCFLYEEVWDACLLPANIEEIVAEHDAVYVCRPNNPSGTIVSFEEMKRLIELARIHETYVVVDEAFIHFSGGESSVVSLCESNPHVIVLRSLTKIYAVPGIRLGYMIASPETIELVSKLQIPWSVNAVALSLIDCLPQCKDFVEDTARYIRNEKQWLSEQLTALGFQLSNTSTNFYLLRDLSLEEHEPLLIFLAEKGILARHTYNFKGLEGKALRFAIRTREENEIIIRYLKEWRDRIC
ncbi:pyridoxal phosphate-dependent aminotransferase [Bacillus massiliigorillae]|uniref:pyridoxal phosphate-dependent aminotransferase n=1 Tax=Bacillus massiliigorillae TaxID=1243664 RepID=UPI0003A21D7C|nr:threonine-phosphate decarboxylase [Bacillus massiliigorillae]